MVRPNGKAPRSTEELCQPSINGRGRPIAPIPIQAIDFGLRHYLIQVQNTCQFHRLPGDDANRHIDKFLEITQHMKQNGVSDDALCLSLFPYSLTHHAIASYDRLPRNSVHSFDDMMRKFLSKYFPPSMVTKLRNEITKFEQKPHNLTQIDTFYNGLTLSHRDTINAAAGGTFMQKSPKECYELIENMTAHHNHWDTSAIRDETSRNISSTSTTESPKTCGVPHSFTECPAVGGYTQETAYATTGNYNLEGNSYQPQCDRNLLSYRSNNYLRPPGFNQPNVKNRYNQNQNQSYNQNRRNTYQAPIQHPQVELSNEFSKYKQITDTSICAMQNQIDNFKAELKNEIHSLMQDQINNVKNELRSDISNQTNELRNMMASFFQKSIASTSGSGPLPNNTIANPRGDLKAITTQSGVSYDGPPIPPSTSSLPKVVERAPEVTKDTPKPTIPYPSRVTKQKLREKDDNLALKFFEIFRNLHFNLSFADALLYMPKFALMFKSLLNNKKKLFDLATTPVNENCLAVIFKKLPKKLGDPEKFLIPCDFTELDECLALADLGASINLMPLFIWRKLSLPELTPTQMILELADRSTTRPAGIAEDIFVKVGKTGRALIDVDGEELTLRVDDEAITFKVGQTTKYSYNDAESISRINVIDVACEEYVQDVLGFPDNSKKEIEACLTRKSIPPGSDDTDFDLEGDIYLLEELLNNDPSSSPVPRKELNFPWVSHIHCVPKKGSMAVVKNDDNELIPTRCMMAIFHDMIEKTMEVFMDDFSAFGDSFSSCLSYLDKMQKRCEDINLVLNWEKCHFMVKVGIVLGHKISKAGIEVNRAKVDVIAKLSHSTSVKGAKNLAADNLSRLENPHQDELEKMGITKTFPLETLGIIAFRGDSSTPWFSDIANYHTGNFIVKGMSSQQKKKFFKDVKHYFLDDPYL
nr:reverse transcriptase domain-containing protein [Tanacetum cinerariifolium]